MKNDVRLELLSVPNAFEGGCWTFVLNAFESTFEVELCTSSDIGMCVCPAR